MMTVLLDSLAAAAPAAAEVITGRVETTSGQSVATGVWTLVGLLVTGAITIAVAIIKQWGPWKQAATEERAADFERLREEIRGHDKEIAALRQELRDSIELVHRAQLQTNLLSAALALVSGELERKDPGNPVIKQARDMVAQAACEDPLAGALVRQLHSRKDA